MGERTCSVAECHKTRWARGFCNTHYAQWRRRSPELVVPNRTGELCHQWTGENATYHALHDRLKAARGPASCYDCVGCGRPAKQWAYDHSDPAPRAEMLGGAYRSEVEYSVDLFRYFPLCARCHQRFDSDYRYEQQPTCPNGHDRKIYMVVIGKDDRRRCRRCHADLAAARKARRAMPAKE